MLPGSALEHFPGLLHLLLLLSMGLRLLEDYKQWTLHHMFLQYLLSVMFALIFTCWLPYIIQDQNQVVQKPSNHASHDQLRLIVTNKLLTSLLPAVWLMLGILHHWCCRRHQCHCHRQTHCPE